MQDLLGTGTIAIEVAGRRLTFRVPLRFESVNTSPTSLTLPPSRLITIRRGMEAEPTRPLDLPAKQCVA